MPILTFHSFKLHDASYGKRSMLVKETLYHISPALMFHEMYFINNMIVRPCDTFDIFFVKQGFGSRKMFIM